MQKTKRKPKIVKSIPPLKIINFSPEDTRANAKIILTKRQKEELLRLWRKDNGSNQIYFVLSPLLTIVALSIIQSMGFFAILVFLVIELLIIYMIRELIKYNVLKDIKIKSFTGTARPYQDDSGWYLAFDDVMTFEITDQPNKLFKPEHKYRVFITDKDKIIIGARALDS
jgi:hypothetical protein